MGDRMTRILNLALKPINKIDVPNAASSNFLQTSYTRISAASDVPNVASNTDIGSHLQQPMSSFTIKNNSNNGKNNNNNSPTNSVLTDYYGTNRNVPFQDAKEVASSHSSEAEVSYNSEREENIENYSDYEESGSEYKPTSDSENSVSALGEVSALEENFEEAQINLELNEEKSNRKGRPKKGRNTKYPGQTFANRKKLKDGNKKHFTVKGKKVEPKFFIDFQCNCTLKCNENVTLAAREIFFKQFWGLESYNAQTTIIAATVTQQGIKKKRNKDSNRRQNTKTYYINNIKVCRDMYIKTLKISPKRVNTALKKIKTGNIKDERGFKCGGYNKLTEETKKMVINHIAKFPTYISHYSRNETEAKFLATDLTLNKMYSLYREDEINHKVGFLTNKAIFYKNFNLRRKPPVKDTCILCDGYTSKIKNCNQNELDETKLQHEQHLLKAKEVRDAMKHDMERAKIDNKVETVTYDKEKVLGLPKLPTNIVYYKRQLSIYNEGVHVASTNTPYCFIWKEGIAGRGAQEVGSCLKKFVDTFLAQETENLILWSDSCEGQNRNIKIVLLLKAILESHISLKTIYLKYLIPGHSFLPNDTDFGEIERKLKYQLRVYTLDEFKKIIELCSPKNKFVGVEMTKDDFLGTSKIEQSITNRKVDSNGEKDNWLQARVIKLCKKNPFSIFMKYSHTDDEDYKEINIRKVTKGRPTSGGPYFASKLFQLYPNGKKISNKKLADIKTLMALIPNDVKHFYRNINGADFEDDIDAFGENIDFIPEEGDQFFSFNVC